MQFADWSRALLMSEENDAELTRSIRMLVHPSVVAATLMHDPASCYGDTRCASVSFAEGNAALACSFHPCLSGRSTDTRRELTMFLSAIAHCASLQNAQSRARLLEFIFQLVDTYCSEMFIRPVASFLVAYVRTEVRHFFDSRSREGHNTMVHLMRVLMKLRCHAAFFLQECGWSFSKSEGSVAFSAQCGRHFTTARRGKEGRQQGHGGRVASTC